MLILPTVVFIISLFFVYLPFVNIISQYENGISRNIVTGQVIVQKPGFYWTAPWVQVASIDLRPQRVCVESAGKAYNCRLAEFDIVFAEDFVKTEGFYYYWWSNRLSVNFGYHEEYRGMRDLMRGYAYSITQYPFVKVVKQNVD